MRVWYTVPITTINRTVAIAHSVNFLDLIHMKIKSPNTENRTVPIRKANIDLRSREYLTPNEIDLLLKTARGNRSGHRDATMILIAYRHGLRSSELCALRWDQFDMKQGTLHVNRLKNGLESVHPLTGTELRALRKLEREEPTNRFLFVSERGSPMSAEGFRKMVRRVSGSSAPTSYLEMM